MINLLSNELRLTAQIRNISHYENKSEKGLIKALSEPKPKPEPKPETKPKPKPETKPTPKPKIIINKKKLEEIRKDFIELSHNFSKTEIDRYRKRFLCYEKLQTSFHIRNKKGKQKSYWIKKSLRFKKFRGNIDSVDYDDLDNYDDNYDFADDDKYRKNGSVRTLFEEFDRDYYKPIRTDSGFDGRRNNYIEYKSKGDRYEHLSPK